MIKPYCFIPNARLAKYGESFFVYDGQSDDSLFIKVPTQAIEEEMYVLISDLQHFFKQGFCSKEDLISFLGDRYDDEVIQKLLHLGIFFDTRITSKSSYYFKHDTFFNAPPADAVKNYDVGLVSLPQASLPSSYGATLGPQALRKATQSQSWFMVHEHGVYSDRCATTPMDIFLGKDSVIADTGEVRADGQSIEQFQNACDEHFARFFDRSGAKPLIVGGDHAVTPVCIRSLIKNYDEIGVLHLDAHHDLFYDTHHPFTHAGVVENILKIEKVSKVVSLGLCTDAGYMQARNTLAQAKNTRVQRCVDQHNLIQTKKYASETDVFKKYLKSLPKIPYYITIDLDVLSEKAMSGNVTTATDEGLRWTEMHSLISSIFEYMDVVGCDVTEFNPLCGNALSPTTSTSLQMLLIQLIDGMALKS